LVALRYLWPFLLLGGVYLWADHGWCNSACQQAKSGLVAANERVKELNGTMMIYRRPQGGTALSVRLPVPISEPEAVLAGAGR